MSSGADLFVVCKQCGSEVSPYVTECPYCGNRLRRRAPKLPRVNEPSAPAGRRGPRSLLSRGSGSSRPTPRQRPSRRTEGRWSTSRPYATIAIIAVSCGVWVATAAEPQIYLHTLIIGKLDGDWWRTLTAQFTYFEHGGEGAYAFVTLLTVGLFGWLLERRHGPAVVLALFLGAGVVGALAAEAAYAQPIIVGANAGALALLAAWVAPDLLALRAGSHHEGDLLGAGALAALLLVIPYGLPEVSWLAGVVGTLLGLLVGAGLGRFAQAEA